MREREKKRKEWARKGWRGQSEEKEEREGRRDAWVLRVGSNIFSNPIRFSPPHPFSQTRAPPLPARRRSPFLPRPPTSSACLPPQIVATKRFPVAPRVPRDYQPARFVPRLAYRDTCFRRPARGKTDSWGRTTHSRFSTLFRVGSRGKGKGTSSPTGTSRLLLLLLFFFLEEEEGEGFRLFSRDEFSWGEEVWGRRVDREW